MAKRCSDAAPAGAYVLPTMEHRSAALREGRVERRRAIVRRRALRQRDRGGILA